MTFRVEIAGSIAVGKSTLCEGLRAAGFEVLTERLEENNFLTRSYNDQAARGFDVMMAFVLSKAAAISTYEGNARCIVTDYALISEYAYNDQHLKGVSKTGHKLCQQTIDLKREQLGEPHILIVLECPVAEQLKRIKERGRDFEQGITASYLRKLNESVKQYVERETNPNTRVIRIDTSKQDLRNPQTIAGIAGIIDEVCRKKRQPRSPAP
jgi:deoxyadenosine/deoxycytidine kinase